MLHCNDCVTCSLSTHSSAGAHEGTDVSLFPSASTAANLCLPSNFLATVLMYRLIMSAAILGDISAQASFEVIESRGGLIRGIVASGKG